MLRSEGQADYLTGSVTMTFESSTNTCALQLTNQTIQSAYYRAPKVNREVANLVCRT